ncbi:zinc finger MYM-type protein 1 isoform X2 [Agrilus planipennis]|uniref:Zinc finger MYM-type protein 1 isoform X2 n=1 Tax=Agrilus planipennis TaxID=224129 RepID=A0A1W4WYW3_AGRPL|nr:zinc finger MYM-type protein 1 isoform X2 [Agrilus planipennis]
MAKTSTERSRLHRLRKSQQAQAKRQAPKTGAQRVREYRARRKALKATAAIVNNPTSQIGDIAPGDMENYILKKDVLPHIFNCQNNGKSAENLHLTLSKGSCLSQRTEILEDSSVAHPESLNSEEIDENQSFNIISEKDQDEDKLDTVAIGNKRKRSCSVEFTAEGLGHTLECKSFTFERNLGIENDEEFHFKSLNADLENCHENIQDVTAVDSEQRDCSTKVIIESIDVNLESKTSKVDKKDAAENKNDEELDSENFAVNLGNGRKRCLIEWSHEEKDVMEKYFCRHIKLRIAPTKQEVLQIIKLYPKIFKDIKWDAIQAYVCNKYNPKKESDCIPFESVQRKENDYIYPFLHIDIKEEPTHLIDPLLEENISEIKIKEELKIITECEGEEDKIAVSPPSSPINDIVRNLLETPFNQWKDNDKCEILQNGRPTNKLSICAKKEIKKTGKSYNINFKSVWFKEYLWLCSSTVLEKLFCWPCLLFSNKNSVWNKEGFSDLLNITRALRKHADSVEHLKSELMLRNFDKNQSMSQNSVNFRLFKIQFNEHVRLNRLLLHVVIDAVLYLGKQHLAFRDHDDSIDPINQGNFKELLSLLLIRSPIEIRNQYEKIKNVFTGDCQSIENDLIGCISEYINDYVTTEISESNFFSIEVDDATDITQSSQCSLIIRLVNSEGKLVERFMGFHDVSADRTSDMLYNILHTILEQFNYEHKLVGQCYDGSSVMSGHLNTLQKKIKDKAPQAVFVHCVVHHLNLVLQQSLVKILSCRLFFASVSGISSFFKDSENSSYTHNSTSPTVPKTRWSCHSKLLNVIIEDWNKLKDVFEFIVTCEQSDKKSIQPAKGFLNDMNSFEFTFLAVVFNEIFCSFDILYDILRKRSLDIIYCMSEVKKTCEILRGKRTDEVFNTLFLKTIALTEFNTKTSVKRKDVDFDQDQIKTKCQVQFFEILDHILMEMDVRFQDCEKIKFVCLIDTTQFERYKSCFPSEALQNLQFHYPNIFTKMQRLRNELSLIYADENYRSKTTLEVFEQLHENKDTFTETFKLFSLVLTIPSTGVSVERSFSCLARIKTYSRSTMSTSQKKLLSLANISIQKELLLDIMKKQPFYEDIIDKFASLNDRKINLIYKK